MQQRNRVVTHAIRVTSGRALAMAGVLMAACAPAWSQTTAQTSQLEEVIVTGIRSALASGIETKRESFTQVDEINAEDMADFPDSNLAESLQRLPGVSIDRVDGEGRTITVRGLGGDFVTTTINGMDALSTAGGGNSGSAPNRSRSFEFNSFASELFGSLKVQKTAAASTDEGSLGSTVALSTPRALDYGRFATALSASGAYYDAGDKVSPRLAGLITDTFFDNRLGIIASAAYSERDSIIDKYDRNTGQADIVYRNSQHAGLTPATFGYARPANATHANPALSCAANPGLLGCGSDPAAYAALPLTAFVPTFPTLSHEEISYERLGVTFGVQWRPTDRSLLSLDYLLSSYKSEEVLYELTNISGNRNGYNAAAATNPASLNAATRRGLYARCDQVTGTVDDRDCGQALYGTTPVAGTQFSFNPNNLEPYDYYNSPASVGYIPSASGIANWAQLVGRPNMQVRDVNVVTNRDGRAFADYIALDNVDWRNAADGTENETTFDQLSLNFEHRFNDALSMNALIGSSKSEYRSDGMLVEFNNLDMDGFVFDERSGGSMPVMNLGFDPADPANWSIVKGLSEVRTVRWAVDNEFETAKLNFTWSFSNVFGVNFGGGRKKFDYSALELRRNSGAQPMIPTEREAGRAIGEFGRMVSYGEGGIDVSNGTPTRWFAPSFDGFRNAFDVQCNCINQWGDWRLNERTGSTNAVSETDTSGYAELTMSAQPGGRRLFGNFGVRYARTEVESAGLLASQILTASNEYNDTLPSLNLAYEVLPDTLLRIGAAKVMSRPRLNDLRPNGNLPTGCTGTSAGCNSAPAFTMGNPYLEPFRATNYDLGLEWYFSSEGLLAAALFYKDIESFPQSVRSDGPLSQVLPPELLNAYVATITDAPLLAYINNGGTFGITTQRDSPGGFIRGAELSYQQPFTFLPAPFNNFGTILNYTRIESELQYIVNSNTGQTQTAPYLNASPNSFNTTLYYATDRWEARVSGAYRSEYMQLFPVSAGTCEIGLTTSGGAPCNAPLINDFRAVQDNLYVDASLRFDVSGYMSLTAEIQNLTDEHTQRWVYSDVEIIQLHQGFGRTFTLGLRVKL